MKSVLGLLLVFCFIDVHEPTNPYFYKKDEVLYKFNDPSLECHVNQSDDLIWNFHKAITPCYKTMDVSISDEGRSIDIFESDGNYATYRIDKKSHVILEREKSADPIFGLHSDINYFSGIHIIKPILSAGESWEQKDRMIYTIPIPQRLSESYDLSDFDSLHMELDLELSISVEAVEKLHLPFNSRRATLLSIGSKYRLNKASISNKSADFDLSANLYQTLNTLVSSTEVFEWKYLSKESPHILAELQFDEKGHCKNFNFYHKETPSNIPFCKPDQENLFLFPNPSFGDVKILAEGVNPGLYYFKIYNVIGREIIVKEFTIESDNQLTQLNLSQLNRGTYLYAITDANGKRLITKKLVILGI